MKRTFSVLFWWSALVLVVSFAVVISIARELAPKLSEYKPEMESYFSEVMGLQIEADHVALEWPGLAPILELRNLTVKSLDGESEVAAASKLSLQVDLMSTLWHGALTTRRAEVYGLQVTIEQLDDGRWFEANESDDELPLRTVIRGLLRTSEITIHDSTLTALAVTGDRIPVEVSSAVLGSNGATRNFDALVKFGELSEPVRFVSTFRGSPWAHEFNGQAYLDMRDQVFDRSFSRLAEEAELDETVVEGLSNIEVSAQWWFSWESIDQFHTQGVFHLGHLPLPDAFQANEITDVRFTTGFEWRDQHIGRGELTEVSFVVNGEVFEIDTIAVEANFMGGASTLGLQVTNVDLSILANNLQRLPAGETRSTLEELNPQGYIAEAHAFIPLKDPLKFVLAGNLVDVDIDAWNGAPSVEGLNAHFVATAFDGYVELQGDPLVAHFPDLYDQHFEFDQVSGRAYWRVDTESKLVHVGAKELKLSGPIGDVTGAFGAQITLEESSLDSSSLVLQLGLDRADVRVQSQLVPKVLSKDLRDWLNAALVSGDINEADFVFRSDLEEDCVACIGLQLTADVQDVELNYLPEWPTIDGISGNVYLDNDEVFADTDTFMYLGGEVTPSLVYLDARDENALLRLNASVGGDAPILSAELLSTPLASALQSTLGRWDLSGRVDGDVFLSARLSAQADVSSTANLNFDNVSLFDEQLDLEVNEIFGQLNLVDNQISAGDLEGVFWRHPVQSELTLKGDSLEVSFSGAVEAVALGEWFGTPLDAFIAGETVIDGLLVLPPEGDAVLTFETALIGTSVELPAPWSKTYAQAVDTTISIPFREDGYAIEVSYGDDLEFDANFIESELSSARLHVGGEMDSEPKADIWVSANLDQIDVQRVVNWVIEKRTAITGSTGELGESKLSFGGELLATRLQVSETLGFDNALAVFDRASDRWVIDLDSDLLTGRLQVPESDAPWLVDIQRLDLPVIDPAPADEQAITLAALQQVPPLDVSIQNLTYDSKPLGIWQFNYRTASDEVRVEDIAGRWNGLTIGDADGEPLWFSWKARDGMDISSFSLAASAERFNESAENLDWQLPFTAESGNIRVTSSWLGTPMDFELYETGSEVDFNFVRGKFQTTSAGSDAMRLLNLFNFNTWARRLQLDFSDLERGGIAYDKVSGKFLLDAGRVVMNDPVRMISPSSRFMMVGEADLIESTVDADLNVTLPVSSNVAWITAIAVSLPAAAGVYLASQIFEEQFDQLSTLSYSVTGSLEDPEVSFEEFFGEPQG